LIATAHNPYIIHEKSTVNRTMVQNYCMPIIKFVDIKLLDFGSLNSILRDIPTNNTRIKRLQLQF